MPWLINIGARWGRSFLHSSRMNQNKGRGFSVLTTLPHHLTWSFLKGLFIVPFIWPVILHSIWSLWIPSGLMSQACKHGRGMLDHYLSSNGVCYIHCDRFISHYCSPLFICNLFSDSSESLVSMLYGLLGGNFTRSLVFWALACHGISRASSVHNFILPPNWP